MVSEYWAGLIAWVRDEMLKEHQYIAPEDLEVFTVADEPDEAVKIIVDFRQKHGPGGLAMPPGMKKGQEYNHSDASRPPPDAVSLRQASQRGVIACDDEAPVIEPFGVPRLRGLKTA